jgi:hypothetical protein
MISKKRWKHLYDAAVDAGQNSTEGRTLEEWIERVSDYGLDDARQSLIYFVQRKYNELTKTVALAAKDYSLAGRQFGIESDKVLDEGIDPKDPPAMGRKLQILIDTYGEEMRRTGKIMNERVDELIAFEAEYQEEIDNYLKCDSMYI